MAKGNGIRGFLMGSMVTAALVVTGIVFLFVYAILGALFGAVAGWFVQIAPVIGPAVREGFVQLGFPVTNLTTVGAALGFASGFFKQNGRDGSAKSYQSGGFESW